jgi:N-acyl-D-aspartate/D-glutamate deacylase
MMFSKSATAMIFFLLCVCTLLSACTHLRTPASYDLVLKSGRVIDPESGLDAVRHIGIRGGQIAAISTEPLHGAEVIDAVGMVIAPGFLDIHSHSPTLFGARFQALDGVTTQLDLEAGAFPVTAYGDYFELGALLNFGASVSHLAIRTKVLTGKDTPYLFSKAGVPTVPQAFTQRASAIEISAMQALLQEGLDSGGLGIGLLLDYISDAVSPAELRMVFEVAGQRGVPVTVHVRRGLPGDPAGLDEVIALAEATGAHLLICHISHSAMHRVDDWLARIDAANARGARISAETLTYSAGGTAISAAVFDRDWQSTFAITYADVQWTATGEWLTEETFKRYRKEQPGGMINHHYVKEEWLRKALRWPGIMVVSDATPAFSASVLSNPNVSGTFTRLLGHYARNEGILNLNEALARTSLHQARWLEKFAPKFRLKGRIQIGMDADLVVFDPRKIAAQATYGKPYEAPIGMAYVIVAGQPIVRKGELAPSVLAGKRLLAGR